jgi:hypothetical protein
MQEINPKPKTTQQIKDECKNINENGMNLYDVITDISKVIGVDLFNAPYFITWRRGGLLHGLPKHSNLYCIIVEYDSTIPKWFSQKYTDIEENIWDDYIER